jgi:hypothetical protein
MRNELSKLSATVWLWAVALISTANGWAATPAQLVSPGAPDRELLIDERCPTFSWIGATGAQQHMQTLEVYRLGERTNELVLRQEIPGSAQSWSPAGAQCLSSPGSYAWLISSRDDNRRTVVSDLARFEVQGGPSEAELRAALALLRELDLSASARPEPAEVASQSRYPERGIAIADFSVDSDGNVIAQKLIGGPSPLLTQVTAVDVACSGCIEDSDVDIEEVQRRIDLSCPASSTIREVLRAGTVECGFDHPLMVAPSDETTVSVVANNLPSTQTIVQPGTNYEICYLTRVDFRDIGGSTEFGLCEINVAYPDGTQYWTITADGGGNGRATCGGRCFRN